MTNLAFPPIPASFDDDEQLGAQITLLAGQINSANHRLLSLIAEFDQRKAWGGDGTVRSCAHWLNWKCGIAPWWRPGKKCAWPTRWWHCR
ncbi:MAG: hypothetical protein KA159_09160 [Halioglobus sp.]|nr:hypothetical protein [Halioglobus sp.]